MRSYDLIQISDLHIGADPNLAGVLAFWDSFEDPWGHGTQPYGVGLQSTHDERIAASVARFLIDHRTDKSLLLISGDLACTGRFEDLNAALSMLQNQPNREPRLYWLDAQMRPTFRNVGLQTFILPGNHDRFTNRLGAPGSRNFDAVFSHLYKTSPSHPSTKRLVIGAQGDLDRLCLIAADFCLTHGQQASRIDGIPGQGFADPTIVDSLVRRTVDTRQQAPDAGIVWVLHFPPTIADIDERLHLIRYKDVLDAAAANNVGLVLAGHVHRKMLTRDCGVTIASAGSAMSVPASAGLWIHILRIESDAGTARLVHRRNFAWSKHAGGFVEQSAD